jgi:transcriptional regulator
MGLGMTSVFGRYSTADVRALIAEHPLAWVLPRGGPAGAASLLPLLGEYGPDGALVSLLGHMGRGNALAAALAADPHATVLFTGPQGYVSPAQAGLDDWGPTWNYAQVAVDCEITVTADLTEPAIGRLVETMEGDGPDAWRAAALGGRYAAMRERIIGFRARVTHLTARFKLGQDENGTVLQSILDTHPDPALVAWMRRMNAERG